MTEEVSQSDIKNFCRCGCGQICKNKYISGHNLAGKNHWNWKGRVSNGRGYIWIRTATNKYEPEHRVIFEKYHKCCLLPWANIHHINGIKDDNRIENLRGFTIAGHTRHHNPLINMDGRICLKCNSDKTFKNKNGQGLWYRYGDGYICSKCYDKIMRDVRKTLNTQ